MLEVREMRLVDAETLRREKDKTVALLEKGMLGEIAAQIRSDLLQSLGLLDEPEHEIALTAGEQCQDNK